MKYNFISIIFLVYKFWELYYSETLSALQW